ncbi:hypothetical protein [Paenibacillus brevis]|uniref:Carbohydrate kinase PfkB domain-containing protein n=1 Tax=Paenibacillus brevis TaxID=2841508 RepID=A0ABS6FYX3_9BACL|nr:hypothetical protein [Paenibacillus brevis]MBU5674325.1 hypothetical protein [Paenibacillus brevis]
MRLCNEGLSGEETWNELLKFWEDKYGSKVILTRGSRGGDCLNAALGYSLAQDRPLHEALAFAVRAAFFSVTRCGAQAGMPALEDILKS